MIYDENVINLAIFVYIDFLKQLIVSFEFISIIDKIEFKKM